MFKFGDYDRRLFVPCLTDMNFYGACNWWSHGRYFYCWQSYFCLAIRRLSFLTRSVITNFNKRRIHIRHILGYPIDIEKRGDHSYSRKLLFKILGQFQMKSNLFRVPIHFRNLKKCKDIAYSFNWNMDNMDIAKHRVGNFGIPVLI